MTPFLVTGFLILLLVFSFFHLARRGRKLREADLAALRSRAACLETVDGQKHWIHRDSPFYLGKGKKSDVILHNATSEFEVCIFFHLGRFAFQTAGKAREILLNGDEQLAGFLSEGDELKIAGKSFVFHAPKKSNGQ